METIIICSLFLFLIYLFVRNVMVFKFEQWLNETGYSIVVSYINSCSEPITDEEWKNIEYLDSVWKSIMDISYSKKVFSFKPLKPKFWLTKEQQDFMCMKKS